MSHRIREGIILRNICGEWLLIAVGKAARHCMYVRQVNDTLAYYWERIAEGLSTEEIIAQACEDYDAPAEMIERDVNRLISRLYEMHYLVRGPEAPEDEREADDP